ncbi:hydrogenase [Sulfodiicoccus acidiphilus]|uniref:Hydrogenase n=1 Tax=Sulfodiicoccus acidiphilus TaxID=1670455 RepID=A0A348B4T6_9CREN|nr:respiratory chain complex I subunit 1 family protein [Sulfodiicoccus acidiphilus]BBD73188.1 hydrogenase [Sulfodiicoccus acidiphilus]GGU01384.1 hydrogenase [Sulfodiicoccus acidiphilus]
MNYSVVEASVQVGAVLLLSPLMAGLLEKFKAFVETRRGPSVLQPYYDLAKLFRKETVVPVEAGKLFLYGPALVFAVYILISFVIPVIYPAPVFLTPTVDFLGGALLFSLASFLKVSQAMESGSNFVALGSARILSFAYLGEGTLISVFFAVALITDTNNPYAAMNYAVILPNYATVPHVVATVAFFMLWMFETGKLPVESSGMWEFGMIEESLLYEYSGRDLGLLKWSNYIKQYLLGSVLLNVFLVPWGLFLGPIGSVIDVGVMVVKWIGLIGVVTVMETTFAKLRLFKVQDFLAVALVLSLFSLILTVVFRG